MTVAVECSRCRCRILLHDDLSGTVHSCPRCRLEFRVVREGSTEPVEQDRIQLQCRRCWQTFTVSRAEWSPSVSCPTCHAVVDAQVARSTPVPDPIREAYSLETRTRRPGESEPRSAGHFAQPVDTSHSPAGPASLRSADQGEIRFRQLADLDNWTETAGENASDVIEVPPAMTEQERRIYGLSFPVADSGQETTSRFALRDRALAWLRRRREATRSERHGPSPVDAGFSRIIQRAYWVQLATLFAVCLMALIALQLSPDSVTDEGLRLLSEWWWGLLLLPVVMAWVAMAAASQISLIRSAFRESEFCGYVYLLMPCYRPWFAMTRYEKHPRTSSAWVIATSTLLTAIFWLATDWLFQDS